MAAGQLRPLIVVWPDRHDLAEDLTRRLGGAIPVLLDRRREDRRREGAPVGSERRAVERRHLLTPEAYSRFRALGYRAVYPPDPGGHRDALAFCFECERFLDFTMPRFVEPPAHVESVVEHRLSGTGVRHVVALEAWLPSGRILLSSRLDAREVADPEEPA